MKNLFILFVLSFTVFFTYTVVAQNWQMQNSNYPANVMIINLCAINNQVCWGVGQIFPGNSTPYAGFIRTTDGGNNWICDTIAGVTNCYFQEIFAIDAYTAYATLYKLIGTSGTDRGIYKTTDGGKNWARQNAYNNSQSGPAYIYFFDLQNGVVVGDPNLETYTTSNGGLTWNPVTMPTPLVGETTWAGGKGITSSGNTAWFGTSGARLFKSTDRGLSWEVMVTNQANWAHCVAFQDEQIGIYALRKAGNYTDHLYRKTTDGGLTWNLLSNPVLDNLAPTSLQHIPGTVSIYIVTGGRTSLMRGTAITHNAGESWTLIDTMGFYTMSFASNTVGWGTLFATNVVYRYVGPPLPVELTSFTATSNGKEVILNWSTATELNNLGFEIQRNTEKKEFFSVGFVNGHGTTSEQQNYNYADKNLNDGKYYYRLKQIDYDGSYEYSDVIEVEWRAFNTYLLEQNYPNPFNPATIIGFGVREKSNVKITILNSIGEEVGTLLNGNKEPGFYQVEFNAANLPSGIYFYQLQAGNFVEIKKMVLLR